MIKILILDFDGVIVESEDIKTEAFRELFQEYENIDDIIQYHLHNSLSSRFEKFRYIYENFLDKEYNEEIEVIVSNKFSEIIFNRLVQCPFVVGAEEFLQTFSKLCPIYVVSASPQEELRKIITIRNIQNYFKGVWGNPNTKIDAISIILKSEKIKPTKAVYVGDRVGDFEIAQKVGVPFIGRRNKESFEGFNVSEFPDLIGVRRWLQGKIE